MNSFKQAIRRFDRKNRRWTNLFLFIIFLTVASILIIKCNDINNKEMEKLYVADKELIQSKFDSLNVEIDRLKVGIEESTIRKFKITTAANIIKSNRKDYSDVECLKLATLIYDEAERTSVKFGYVLAVMRTESRFAYKAVSNVGARGLMQIMPETFILISKKYGYDYTEKDMYDLKKNVRVGCLYIMHLKNYYDRSELISAGYNGGPRVAANYKLFMQGKDVYVPDETKNYVKTVNKYFREYSNMLGE